MAGPITRRRLLAAGVALPGCLGHRTDREIEHDLSKRVLACLNEDDADGLEALFCEASRARPELRAEMARGMGASEKTWCGCAVLSASFALSDSKQRNKSSLHPPKLHGAT